MGWKNGINPEIQPSLVFMLRIGLSIMTLLSMSGVRYDRIDIDNWIPIDLTRPELTWNKQTQDIIPTGLVQTECKRLY